MGTTLLSTLILSACFFGQKGEGRSENGLLPEGFLPKDTSVILSYSLLDKEQFEAVSALGDRFDSKKQIQDYSGTQFNVDLDLEEALGDQFKMVMGLRNVDASDEADLFMVYTLSHPDKLQKQLDELVESEDLTEKKLSSITAYVEEDEHFYAALDQDVLLVANSAENLVSMSSQKEKDSLWANAEYQDALKALTEPQIFTLFSLENLATADLVDQQIIAARAEADGFKIYGKSQLKEGASILHEPAYLFKEVPAKGMMLYVESNALADTLATSENAEKTVQSYLALDSELADFLNKGYVMSLHQNSEGAFPGISFFADVSEDPKAAQEALSSIEVQIQNMKVFLDSFLPGAAEEGETEIGGASFKTLSLDFSNLEEEDAVLPLPSAITDSVIQIAYGIFDGRLLITTADVWGEEGESISETDLYKKLSKKMDSNEGLVLLDSQGILDYLDELEVLRNSLGLSTEDSQATGDQLQSLLSEFEGGILSGKTKGLESEFSGFLLLK